VLVSPDPIVTPGTVVVLAFEVLVPKENPEGLKVDVVVLAGLEFVELKLVPNVNPGVEVGLELVVAGSVVVELVAVFDEPVPKVNPAEAVGLVLEGFDVPKEIPVVEVLGSPVVVFDEFKSSDVSEGLVPKLNPGVEEGLELVAFGVPTVNPVVVTGSADVVGLELFVFDVLVPKEKPDGVEDCVLPDVLISLVPVLVFVVVGLELVVFDVLVPKEKPEGVED
jgi:hypothetical protein